MSYHRLIGGKHDGEWCDVRRRKGLFLPQSWTVAAHPGFVTNFNDAVPVEPQTLTLTEYVQLPLHVGKHEVVTFYIEKSMTPENALLRLAECYKP